MTDIWFFVAIVVAFTAGGVVGWFQRRANEETIIRDFARWVNTPPGAEFRRGRVQGRMDAIDSVASWVERQENDEPA